MKKFSLSIIILLLIFVYTCTAEEELKNSKISLTQDESATLSIPAYRMVQFDTNREQLGCQRTSFSGPLTTQFSDKPYRYTRYVVLFKLEAFFEAIEKHGNLTQIVDRGDIRGIVVLVPAGRGFDASRRARYNKLEQEWLINRYDKPIYFMMENEQTLALFQELSASTATASSVSSDFHVSLQQKEATMVPDFQFTNLVGHLSMGAGEQKKNRTTIGLVAHYDSLSTVPGLGGGVDANGSGVAAMMAIAKFLKKLSSSMRTAAPSFQFVFMLTDGGRFSYEGTRKQLKSQDPFVSSLDMVFCLESLASSSSLYLHLSEKTSHPLMKQFISAASTYSRENGHAFQVVIKKSNPTALELSWEHEHFVRHGIVAGTLSGRSKPSPQLLRASPLTDIIPAEGTIHTSHHLSLLLSTFSHMLFPHHDVSSLQSFTKTFIDDGFIESWLHAFKKTPRAPPFASPDASHFFDGLRSEFASFLDAPPTKHVFPSSSNRYTFYNNHEVSLSIYRVKSWLFMSLLIVPTILYLLFLYILSYSFFHGWRLFKVDHGL